MRILIAGPAKAGNVWAKCLIANSLGLRTLTTPELPEGATFENLKAWLDAGRFPDNTIFHQHYVYSPELADTVSAVPAHLVTVVRDPYDAFVSAYYSVQNVSGRRRDKTARTTAILDKALDSEEIYRHLRKGGFKQNMKRASDWVQSGRSTIIRYEGLHKDPAAELKRVAEAVGRPLTDEQIAQAVDFCSADRMRQQGGATAKHVRAAKVGDSREKLNDQHLAIFRELHSDLIRSMGYEVR